MGKIQTEVQQKGLEGIRRGVTGVTSGTGVMGSFPHHKSARSEDWSIKRPKSDSPAHAFGPQPRSKMELRQTYLTAP